MTHDPVVVYMAACLCLAAVFYAVSNMVVLRDKGGNKENE